MQSVIRHQHCSSIGQHSSQDPQAGMGSDGEAGDTPRSMAAPWLATAAQQLLRLASGQQHSLACPLALSAGARHRAAPAAAALPSTSFSSTTWKRPRRLEAARSGSPGAAGPRWSMSADSLQPVTALQPCCRARPTRLSALQGPVRALALDAALGMWWHHSGWQHAPCDAQGCFRRSAIDCRCFTLVHIKPAVSLRTIRSQLVACSCCAAVAHTAGRQLASIGRCALLCRQGRHLVRLASPPAGYSAAVYMRHAGTPWPVRMARLTWRQSASSGRWKHQATLVWTEHCC